MIESLLLGAGFAFAAGVQPGPLQAFLLAQVAARGWRRTLPAACAPLVSDGPIALLALLVLGQLTPPVQLVLRAAGGGLLLFLAWGAFRQANAPAVDQAQEQGRVPRTLLEAALVNVLNPNPYLGWALVLGPASLTAWRRAPAEGIALVVAFYGTMVVTLGATILAFGTSRFLGPRGRRGLRLGSAAALAGLGVYQLGYCLVALARQGSPG